MKKFTILICFKLALVLLICSNAVSFATQENLLSLEKQLFNTSFISESVESRLDRIEISIFGRTYNESINTRLQRIENLNRKAPSYHNGYNTPYNKQTVQSSQPVIQDNSATDYPSVTLLEKKVFNSTFNNENIYLRLNRLEKQVLGSIFPNENLANRVDRLKEVINTSNFNNQVVNNSPPAIRSADGSIYENLCALEYKAFNRTFDKEFVSQRISRLENKIFGAAQSGPTVNRISNLNMAVETRFIPSSPNNYNQSNIASGFSQSGFNSFDSIEFDEEDDKFFNDNTFNENSSITNNKTGFLEVLQILALPFIAGFLNRNSNPTPQYNNYPYSPYYGNPNYMPGNYYPYPYSYPYNQPSYQSRFLNQNSFGTGVRIIP